MYKNSKINMESLINSDFYLGEIMNIDGTNINIDDLISDKYFHQKINDNLYLSNYQIEVLTKKNRISKFNPKTINI